MTLKTRNLYFLVLFVAGTVFFLLNIFLISAAFLKGFPELPDNMVRAKWISALPFCKYSLNSTLMSLIMFLIVPPVLSFMVYWHFEKTPSLEIFFFSGIVFSAMAESTRLWSFLAAAWTSYSLFSVSMGRILVAGRLLFALTMFFSSIASIQEDGQNDIRHFVFMVATALSMAMVCPMNSLEIRTGFSLLWAFPILFKVILFIICFTATLTTVIQGWNAGIKSYYIKASGIASMSIGWYILCYADCWGIFVPAVILTGAGIFIYLKTVHSIQNIWG